MGDTVKAKKQKKNWFKGLKAEFSKIIWPDRQSLTKETVAVLAVRIIRCNHCSCGFNCPLWN